MAITAMRDIVNGTAADATDVQFNFQTLETYVNGLSDGSNIDSSAITLTKMAANSVDSDQYVDGSIDPAHLADDAVTPTKLDLAEAVFTDASYTITTSASDAGFTATTDPNGWISGGSATAPACPATGVYIVRLEMDSVSGGRDPQQRSSHIIGQRWVNLDLPTSGSSGVSEVVYMTAGDTMTLSGSTGGGTLTWVNVRIRIWRLD